MKEFTRVTWQYYDNGYKQVAHYFAKGYEEKAQAMFNSVERNPYLDNAKIDMVQLSDSDIQEIINKEADGWQNIHDSNYAKKYNEVFGG